MFCPKCGNEIAAGSRFCGNCGYQLDNAMGAGMTGESQPDSHPQPEPYAQPEPYPQPEPYAQPQPEIVPYSAPYNAPTPHGGVSPLATDRSLATYILLSIVTCGIYGYYFVYQMAQDTNTICEGDGENTPGLVAFILLSFFTCGIYSIYWQYQLAKRLDNNAPRYGVMLMQHANDVVLWLVLGVVTCIFPLSYVAVFYIIRNLNMMSEAYNRANGLA